MNKSKENKTTYTVRIINEKTRSIKLESHEMPTKEEAMQLRDEIGWCEGGLLELVSHYDNGIYSEKEVINPYDENWGSNVTYSARVVDKTTNEIKLESLRTLTRSDALKLKGELIDSPYDVFELLTHKPKNDYADVEIIDGDTEKTEEIKLVMAMSLLSRVADGEESFEEFTQTLAEINSFLEEVGFSQEKIS